MPMDETLAVAAIDLGGRPHTVVDLKVSAARVGDLQTELVHDFFEGFAHRRPGQRSHQGHVRPVEPSQDRSLLQGVRARAARGLREGQASRANAAFDQGTAVNDCAHRLRRREPHLGEEGARGDRRQRRPCRRRRTSCGGRMASSCPVSDTSAPPAPSTRTGSMRSADSSSDGRPLLGICLGMQWLFEGSDEAPDCPGLGLLSGRC